jgi:hypothetical protein
MATFQDRAQAAIAQLDKEVRFPFLRFFSFTAFSNYDDDVAVYVHFVVGWLFDLFFYLPCLALHLVPQGFLGRNNDQTEMVHPFTNH